MGVRGGRGRAVTARAIAGAATTAEELGGAEGLVEEGAARRAEGDPEVHLGVGEAVDVEQAREELAAERRVDERRREVEIADEDLAVKAAGRHRAKQGALEDVVVDGALGAKHFGERRGRAVDLDGHDEAARDVHPVDATVELGELQRAGRPRAVQRAEEIAQRGRSEPSGELHVPTGTKARANEPNSRRMRGG
jgi:hypothetical protein